jgi:PAS domain S-box-containing protein
VLESISDAFFALDFDWRFTYLNSAAEQLLLRPRAGLLGKVLWAEFPQAAGTLFEREYRRAMAERVTARFVERYPSLETWFEVRAYPTPTGLSVYFQGINDRRRMEEELRRSEARYRSLVTATSAIVWTTDGQGAIVDDNASWQRFTGQTFEQCRGWGWLDAIHPGDRDATAAAWRAALAARAPYRVEYRIAHRAGGYRHVVARGAPVPDGADGLVEWVGTCTDVDEQRRAAEARRMSDFRLQRLIEQSPLSVQILAPDGTTRQVNRAWERLWAISPAELASYNMLADAELERNGVMALIRRAFAGEAVTIPPIPYRPDRGQHAGRVRWVGAYVYPVRDDAGRVEEVVIVHDDVTERREAELALADSRRRLQALFDTAQDAIFLADDRARYVDVNPAACALTGYARDELLRMSVWDVTPLPDHAAGDDLWRQFVEAGRLSGEYVLRRKDGGAVTAEYRAVANIEPGLHLSVLRDVTERRRAADELVATRERLELALEASELGTFHCPMPLGTIVWNAKCSEHFFLPPDAEVDFELFYAILHPDDRARTREAVERAVFEHGGYDIEYRTVSPDGARVRWVRAIGRGFYDAAGRPTRFDGVTIDVTDRKRVEEERERLLAAERAARAEAERASRMKDEFLATLSHELRTPLNAILGWAQILRGAPAAADDVAEGLDVIERNARAQTRIIDDLLDMSRIISGKVRLDVRRIDLWPVVLAAVETVRHAAGAKGVRLDVAAVGAGGAAVVTGDPQRLQQVFWNLLSNAVKFSPGGSTVRVRLARADGRAEVSVADAGEGIRPDFLPFVFDRFRQADASTTRRHGGLGLGLSIVKQLAELHGGTVRATSAGPGQGATFTLTLPLAATGTAPPGGGAAAGPTAPAGAPPPAEAEPVFATAAALDLTGVVAVVVDDEPDARELVRRLLADRGARVVTAASAGEALDALRRVRPHVLVSDIAMPGEDGYALIRRVRALPAADGGQTPALALTAYARAEDRMRAVVAGFQHHVPKPVEPAELVTMVASLAGRA